jgi:hypothetical protein
MNLTEIKSGLINASASMNRRLKEMKDHKNDRASMVLNEVLELAPLIDVTGFSMREVIVKAGIPTGATIIFVKEKEVDTATIEALLGKNKDNDLLFMIIKALQKAEVLQKKMNLSNFRFSTLQLKLGVPPEVSLKFSRIG